VNQQDRFAIEPVLFHRTSLMVVGMVETSA